MKKRLISIAVVITLIITVFGGNTFYKSIEANAEVYRNGFTLIPQKQDATGIDTQTTFILKSEEEDITIEDIQLELGIQPEVMFNVSQEENGYLITLEEELEKNSLYTFTFKSSTWLFQTMSDFKLLGTLPGTETTNVPVETGIEFYFSHAGAQVKDYFEIQPSVKGSFESHGNVVVFVPKELQEKTIYTVTLKNGLPLEGSDQTLEEDVTFTFETAAKEESDYVQPKGYFNFNNMINEFGSEEIPKIPMNYYIYEKTDQDTIKANVYAYKTVDDFIEALDTYNETPIWSNFGIEDYHISTDYLTKVMTFEQPIDQDRSYQRFLDLPEELPEGFYLVDCTWEDVQFQTFIQVTDLSFYYMESINGSLIWMNDLKSGEVVSGAEVIEVKSGDTYTGNEQGIVEIDDDQDAMNIYKITDDNREAVLLAYNYDYWYGRNQGNMYWRYFQTDRGLYQPDDTIELWGFLQHRYEDLSIDEVTVEISQGGWWWYWDCLPYFGEEMPLVTETLKVENGFYNGELTLPNLEEGGYQISVKYKDEIISNTYIDVQNYVKPAYKIEVSKDKEAIFVGEEVNFAINTLFFEGTPVANLNVNYNINGLTYLEGESRTDLQGKSTISYTPEYKADRQGINYSYINAYAKLPESGEIYARDTIRVFINDINVNLETKIEDNKGLILAKVNEIVLDRINDGTAVNQDDYLGDPVSNKRITGTIYKNEWKKKEVGQYYDFINKVVKKQYDYYKETTKLEDIILITDNEGNAEAKVNLPDDNNCYYTVKLNTTDNSGRKMEFDRSFNESWHYNPYEYQRYILEGDKEEYDVDETMNITFKNNDEPLEEGNYLYVTAQNGIKGYELSDSSSYSKVFDAASIPNIEIRGIYFNGKTYVQSESFNPRVNFEKNRIVFTAETDKTGYQPGEECKVTLKAQVYSPVTQNLIDAKDVMVNVSIVDEALLQLRDQTIDPLQYLYEWVSGGIKSTYASHNNNDNNMIRPLRSGVYMEKEEATKEAFAPQDSAVNLSVTMDTANNESEVYVRSEFKDTAFFRTIQLDEKGEGELTFKLPDNVTAWRMTFAGISETLKAGSNVEELKVTLPYFISTNLNSTYLVGDQPFIGVTAYGNELQEGEKIEYEISCQETGYVTTAIGNAFERVNIPLWEMEEGKYHITIKAISESGYTDGLEQQISVIKTYHEIETADYYELKPGLTLETTNKGITQLTFVDQGKGKFMPALYSLAYSGGKRIDQQYVAYKARQILVDHYGVDIKDNNEVKLSDYQREDGGLSILPYAESDIETTVKLLPVIKDDINQFKVKMYLYNELNNEENRNKAAALYGLAILGEPVLLDVQKYEEIDNLTLKEQIYLALAYAEIGDSYKANALYEGKVKTFVESYDNIARIKYGATEDSYLEYTALTMLLASSLDLEEKELFYDYVVGEYSKEILVNSEKLNYIINEMDESIDKELVVTYSYDGETYEKKIENGWPVTIKVPSSKLDDFKVKKVIGEAALVASYTKALSTAFQVDEDLKVSRSFINYSTDENTNEFQQFDIVKVMINWDIAKTAIDDTYMITDYAPSGLKPINNPWNMGLKTENGYWYRDVEGQKVTFYVNKNSEERRPLYYYARVITPGTYQAEGTIIQGTKVKESMAIGESDTIIINE